MCALSWTPWVTLSKHIRYVSGLLCQSSCWLAFLHTLVRTVNIFAVLLEDLPWIMALFFSNVLRWVFSTFFPLRPTVRAGHTGGSVGQPPVAPFYKGRCDVTGIIGNVVLVNSDFHKPKNFSKNCPRWTRTLGKIASSFLDRKILIFCWPCISVCLFININQLDALNFIISLFQASTCFEHMCLSSGGQSCITQSLVSSL